jgi:hypothetical protein
MWEPQPLTTLRASKACRGENFTLLGEMNPKNIFRLLNNVDLKNTYIFISLNKIILKITLKS